MTSPNSLLTEFGSIHHRLESCDQSFYGTPVDVQLKNTQNFKILLHYLKNIQKKKLKERNWFQDNPKRSSLSFFVTQQNSDYLKIEKGPL